MTQVTQTSKKQTGKSNSGKAAPKAVKTPEAVVKNNNSKAWQQAMAKIVAKQEQERAEREAAKAEAAKNRKKTGVIAFIQSTLEAAKKPITEAQILEKLVTEFPKREASSMTSTIKAQIGGKKRPLRMEREKGIILDIQQNKAGVKTYSVVKL